MNVRNAEAWQLAAPCLIAAGLGVAAWRSRGDIAGAAARSRRLGACVAVVALVCGVFFPVQAVMRARLAPEYLSTKLVYKIFWHNVGIGFSVSPYFRDTYNLALSDGSYLVFVAQSPEVATAGEPGRRVFWTGTYTGQWVGGDPEIPEASAMNHVGMVRDFAGYERFARQVVFRLAQSHPWPTIKLFLYDKPKLLVRQLVNAIAVGAYSAADLMLEDQSGALLDGQSRRALRAYLQPVSIPSIIAVAMLAGCLVVSRQADRSAIAAMPAILLVLSTLPLIATYPLVHLMASFLAASMFAVLVCAGFVCAALFDQVWRDGGRVDQKQGHPPSSTTLMARGAWVLEGEAHPAEPCSVRLELSHAGSQLFGLVPDGER